MNELLSFSNCQLMHSGGEALVYRAKYKKNETVALKVYKEGFHLNEIFYSQLKKNKHPNMASILNFGFNNGCFWVCSEYIQGISSSLASPFSVPIALHMLRGVVSGLSFLQKNGFSHGDLAPDNILITKEGRAVLIDGGILGPGHLCYMAPERFESAKPTPQSDLFSLGILLYFWLTGKLPFEHNDYDSLVEEILHLKKQKLSVLLHLQNTFSLEEIAALDLIWNGLIQINPEDRFSDLDELDEHLEMALLNLGKQAVFLEKNYQKWLTSLGEKIAEQEFFLDQKPVLYPKINQSRIWFKPWVLVIFMMILFFFFILLFNQEKENASVLETGKQMLERARSQEIPLESKSESKGVEIDNVPRPIDIINKDSI